MKFQISFFELVETDGKVSCNGLPIAQINVAGRDKGNHLGAKSIGTSESDSLRYVSHEAQAGRLVIEQKNDLLTVRTVLTGYEDTNTVRIYTELENISEEELVLEQVGAFALGLEWPRANMDEIFFTRFRQGHHGECQPRTNSLMECGLSDLVTTGQSRIAQANVGSWSTKEELPQGILQSQNAAWMFQIECNHSWYYEISDYSSRGLYLYLGGANAAFGSWCKCLAPGARYQTVAVALSRAETQEAVIGEMTKYRRHIAGQCRADEALPAIFNEYMHLSWDSPSEEGVRTYAPVVKQTGVRYYVIDCGWHDEVPGNVIYPYVGKWVESHARFPSGLRATTDYIRSLGMLPGLWIEPEIVGKLCEEMIAYYGDECFIRRHGKKVCTMGRLFLDFRVQKVRDYLTETIRRMVEDYGAAYIKFDYNQDVGIGCDVDADSFGEGLEQCAQAYLSWVDEMRVRFSDVLFETCSSGGMRMDYETLRHFSIVSTSDQVNYRRYPYIAANILAGVLPEQAAVWSYPVGSHAVPEGKTLAQVVAEHVGDEQVIMNMINSFLGRMHLASHLELLSADQLALVKAGVDYYHSLTEVKRHALPVFPLGLACEEDTILAAGLASEDTLYLAVWNLGGACHVEIPLAGKYENVRCAYPVQASPEVSLKEHCLKICFTEEVQARFFELKEEIE